jgi:hypothetical protein
VLIVLVSKTIVVLIMTIVVACAHLHINGYGMGVIKQVYAYVTQLSKYIRLVVASIVALYPTSLELSLTISVTVLPPLLGMQPP